MDCLTPLEELILTQKQKRSKRSTRKVTNVLCFELSTMGNHETTQCTPGVGHTRDRSAKYVAWTVQSIQKFQNYNYVFDIVRIF